MSLAKLNLLPAGDVNARSGRHQRPRRGEFLVIGHGDPVAARLAGLDAAALAKRIADHPGWQAGMVVRLDACRLGAPGCTLPQQLADRLGATVLAATTRTLSFGPWSSGPWHAMRLTRRRVLPLWPGRWRRFEPRLERGREWRPEAARRA